MATKLNLDSIAEIIIGEGLKTSLSTCGDGVTLEVSAQEQTDEAHRDNNIRFEAESTGDLIGLSGTAELEVEHIFREVRAYIRNMQHGLKEWEEASWEKMLGESNWTLLKRLAGACDIDIISPNPVLKKATAKIEELHAELEVSDALIKSNPTEPAPGPSLASRNYAEIKYLRNLRAAEKAPKKGQGSIGKLVKTDYYPGLIKALNSLQNHPSHPAARICDFTGCSSRMFRDLLNSRYERAGLHVLTRLVVYCEEYVVRAQLERILGIWRVEQTEIET